MNFLNIFSGYLKHVPQQFLTEFLRYWNKTRQPDSTKQYRQTRYPIELRIMSELKHPNLAHVYDVFLERNTNNREWERRTFIWMEMSKSDLSRLAFETPNHKLPEKVVSLLISHALNGLEFLHESGIAHRDIKPPNILVFDTPQGQIAKIIDYSLIREADQNAISRTVAGTPGYQSPQCLLGRHSPFKMDVFAMGITIFEVMVGRHPNWNPKIGDRESVTNEFQGLQYDVDCNISSSTLRSLLKTNILTMNDDQRFTVKELKGHKWFPDVSSHPMYKVPGAIKGFNNA